MPTIALVRNIILAIIATSLIGCNESNPDLLVAALANERADTNVGAFLFDRVRESRLVLISDAAHGQWFPKQSVLSLLEDWYESQTDTMLADIENVRQVALVLECDSLMVGRIDRYLTTLDPVGLLSIPLVCAGVFSSADMEFYCRLGRLNRLIHDFNSAAGPADSLDLIILPGEPSIDFAAWSFDKRDRYFLTIRDSLVAMQITRLLQTYPDYRFIVFYGTSHLQRNRALKQAGDQQSEGWYLASYLDRRLEDSLCVVGQTVPSYWLNHSQSFKKPFQAYGVNLRYPQESVERVLGGRAGYDAAIVHRRVAEYGKPIIRVPSMQLAHLFVDSLQGLRDVNNDYARAYLSVISGYLSAIAAVAPESVDWHDSTSRVTEAARWKRWLDSVPASIVPDISSLDLYSRLIDSLDEARSQKRSYYQQTLGILLPRAPESATVDEYRRYLHTEGNEIRVDNLLGLLWIGNELERREAAQLLEELTDTAFDWPKDWAAWHRQQLGVQ